MNTFKKSPVTYIAKCSKEQTDKPLYLAGVFYYEKSYLRNLQNHITN